VEIKPHEQLVIKVDGSTRLTLRNRRFAKQLYGQDQFQRRVPDPSTTIPNLSTRLPTSSTPTPPPAFTPPQTTSPPATRQPCSSCLLPILPSEYGMADMEELPNNPADDLADHTSCRSPRGRLVRGQAPQPVSPPAHQSRRKVTVNLKFQGKMMALYKDVLMIIPSHPDQEEIENQM